MVRDDIMSCGLSTSTEGADRDDAISDVDRTRDELLRRATATERLLEQSFDHEACAGFS